MSLSCTAALPVHVADGAGSVRTPALLLMIDLHSFFAHYGVALLGLLIVIVGLFGFGLRDLMRFSIVRVWTLSNLCFRESIRRRVLWITPLAMLAVIAVCQLGRPVDQQDAIRQTIKYCIFTTGFVVTLATIILACTNLPKEIESRVIYTVVTKPPTRLEVILGKVLGFWRVALAILLIMGLFTLVYVQARSAQLRGEVARQLQQLSMIDSRWPALHHYQQAGLLQAKTFVQPSAMNIYSRFPEPGDAVRWTLADEENNILVPFDMPENFLPPEAVSSAATPQPAGKQGAPSTQAIHDGIEIVPVNIHVQEHPAVNFRWQKTGREDQSDGREPEALAGISPMIHPEKEPVLPEAFAMPELTGERAHARLATNVQVDLSDPDEFSMMIPSEIYHSDFLLPFPAGAEVPVIAAYAAAKIEPIPEGGVKRVYVRLSGQSTGAEIGVGPDAVMLRCRGKVLHQARAGGKVVPAHFVGRPGAHGQQLRGGPPAEFLTPLADFSFNGSQTPQADASGQVPFELRVGVERGGGAAHSNAQDVTEVTVEIVNRTNPGHDWESRTPIRVENNRITYFSVPAAAVRGRFHAVVRCITLGQHLGLHSDSLRLVSSVHPFVYNLFKSLAVMWLMALLVVIVAVLCSTFLSWPIAVVLTIVILLGHWGVIELGDAAQPGVGHMVVQDLFRGANPSTSQVVSSSVEGMTRMLNALAKVLPDVAQFPAMQFVQDGLMMPWSALAHAAEQSLGFGIPLFVLGFFIFQRKEIAL